MTSIRDLPPGHWVCSHLPDGRTAIAAWDDPIVPAMRRILAAQVNDPRTRFPGRPADYAAVTNWLDAREPPQAGQLALWQDAA